jgi:hypothetical protein
MHGDADAAQRGDDVVKLGPCSLGNIANAGALKGIVGLCLRVGAEMMWADHDNRPRCLCLHDQ